MNIFLGKGNEILKEIISETLEKMKEKIKKGKVKFQHSEKNQETFRILRRKHGITYDDFQEEVIEGMLELEVENYYEGPSEDNKPERGVIFWKFGMIIYDIEIYLKFETKEEKGEEIVIWSYHIPEYDINYPFKKVRK